MQAMVKAKRFSHPKIEVSEGSQSSVGGAQFGTRYRDCMGKTDRPSCATNFQHFIIVYVRMEGYRCCVGTTPRSHRTYVRTNAEDKLRLFATNSAFCGGFEPWTICYFPHHPTTRPHVTCGCGCGSGCGCGCGCGYGCGSSCSRYSKLEYLVWVIHTNKRDT